LEQWLCERRVEVNTPLLLHPFVAGGRIGTACHWLEIIVIISILRVELLIFLSIKEAICGGTHKQSGIIAN
jgi:hypothetical protein